MAKKILILTYKFPPRHLSGLEMGADFMARHLAKQGHEVHVLVTRRDQGQSFRAQQFGYSLWRLPVLNIPLLRSLWELLVASLIIVWIRPDQLHGQALFPCGWLAGLWSRLLNRKSLTYLYGRDVVHPSWFLRQFLGSQALRWNHVVLAATRQCHQDAQKILNKKIQIFYSGFEPPEVWPDELSRDPQKILFVGRLEDEKGFDILIEALKHLKSSWSLSVVGSGSKESLWKKNIEDAGLAQKVEWLGRIENDAIYRLMATSQVLVLPSREEPYGVVLLEALASGARVVATKVGGIPEIVDDASKGWLVPPNDPQALSQALDLALQASPLDSQVRGEIRAGYGWEQKTKELADHYEL